jgi:hypothetical protein
MNTTLTGCSLATVDYSPQWSCDHQASAPPAAGRAIGSGRPAPQSTACSTCRWNAGAPLPPS